VPPSPSPAADHTAEVGPLAARLRAVLGPLSRELRQQASEPLTATQVSVLVTIHRHGPLALGEVASRERLSPPMISKVVDALEQADFVERVRDREDRRVWMVSATEAADRWMEQGRARRDAWIAERLELMDDADRHLLARAVPLLERLISDQP
jgi:DNA-binding MarR family transcriptional regulator